MKIAPVADIKAHFSDYLKKSEKGPIVVTKNGKPVAVLLEIKDEEEIERLLMAYSSKSYLFDNAQLACCLIRTPSHLASAHLAMTASKTLNNLTDCNLLYGEYDVFIVVEGDKGVKELKEFVEEHSLTIFPTRHTWADFFWQSD